MLAAKQIRPNKGLKNTTLCFQTEQISNNLKIYACFLPKQPYIVCIESCFKR